MGFLMEWLFEKIMLQAPGIAAAALIVLVSFLAAGIVQRLVCRIAGRFSDGKRQVLVLVASAVRIIILIFGVITALGTMGINVSALVAGLGLSGFALGFALKDALSNLLAGAMILIYQPFKTGDSIVVSGCEGVVEEINLRYTILKGSDCTYLIPNSSLFTTLIQLKPSGKSGS